MTPRGSQKVTPFQLGRQFCERLTYFFLPKNPLYLHYDHLSAYYTKHLMKKPPYLSSIFTRISAAAAFSDCKHPPSFLHATRISSLPSFPFKSKQTVCVCSASFSLVPPHPPPFNSSPPTGSDSCGASTPPSSSPPFLSHPFYSGSPQSPMTWSRRSSNMRVVAIHPPSSHT